MDRRRFETLLPTESAKKTKVFLVGCGGIGSYTAALLARMGLGKITLLDFDKVEDTNVSTQDLDCEDIGQYKVDSVAGRIGGLNDQILIETIADKFSSYLTAERPDHIVIAAVDNMEARRDIYDSLTMGQVLVDPRMGAESFEMWVMRKGSAFEAEYKRSLFDPTPRPELPCGARAIAYTGAFAGAMVASAVRRAIMSPTYESWVVGDVGSMRTEVLREII